MAWPRHGLVWSSHVALAVPPEDDEQGSLCLWTGGGLWRWTEVWRWSARNTGWAVKRSRQTEKETETQAGIWEPYYVKGSPNGDMWPAEEGGWRLLLPSNVSKSLRSGRKQVIWFCSDIWTPLPFLNGHLCAHILLRAWPPLLMFHLQLLRVTGKMSAHLLRGLHDWELLRETKVGLSWQA